MWFIVVVICVLFFVQFLHMYSNWAYKRKLENDPKFKLLEETKNYSSCFVLYEPNVWLDSTSNGNIKFVDYDIYGKEKVHYEGSLNDSFVKEIIEAKKINGYSLKQCRECGNLDFYPNYKSDWNGFCQYTKKCIRKCAERDFRHIKRTDQNLHSWPEENKIPMYEFAKKQNFLCAICNGKMNHKWSDDPYQNYLNHILNNYLYHTIDHIKPISLGGKHQNNNIQIVHFICNKIKGTGNNITLIENIENVLEKILLNNNELLYNEELLIKELRIKYIK